ncbi:MAG: Fic family protein [Bacilli bacterium]|nr:Fic family protein [Bacilli bacterium]
MTKQENDILWNSYFYPGTNILKNNLNIKDKYKLKKAEATYTFKKLFELRNLPLDEDINKNRLNDIHKYLFKEIYPFAGEYRKVDMSKERGTFLEINSPEDIDTELNLLFEKTNEMINHCHSINEFCEVLSTLYTYLIFIHPYREGNGRTIREFLREYSLKKSEEIGLGKLELDWSKVIREELDKYLEIAHILPSYISPIFMNALTPKEKGKNK